MKTIILYGTTYGFSQMCAERLSDHLEGEVELVNLMKDSVQDLSQYDHVIIGGSVYMGQVQKKVKAFCQKHEAILCKKNLGLFLCCGSATQFEVFLNNNFSPNILEAAGIKACFGGELNPEKMGLVHKIITNMVLKANAKSGVEPVSIQKEEIVRMAEYFNAEKA